MTTRTCKSGSLGHRGSIGPSCGQGLLTNRSATGHYRILMAAEDWKFGLISRADVADFIVRQVDDRVLIGATPLLIH